MAQERSEAFVRWVLAHENDKSFMAKLRKAGSETTAPQAWELLARWIDLDNPWERRAFSLVGANLTHTKASVDGTLGVGAALRTLFMQKDGGKEIETSSEAARLRRLLSCRDQEELVNILNPIIRYLTTKGVMLSFARLLDELLYFNVETSQERTKIRWVQEFHQKTWTQENEQ